MKNKIVVFTGSPIDPYEKVNSSGYNWEDIKKSCTNEDFPLNPVPVIDYYNSLRSNAINAGYPDEYVELFKTFENIENFDVLIYQENILGISDRYLAYLNNTVEDFYNKYPSINVYNLRGSIFYICDTDNTFMEKACFENQKYTDLSPFGNIWRPSVVWPKEQYRFIEDSNSSIEYSDIVIFMYVDFSNPFYESIIDKLNKNKIIFFIDCNENSLKYIPKTILGSSYVFNGDNISRVFKIVRDELDNFKINNVDE